MVSGLQRAVVNNLSLQLTGCKKEFCELKASEMSGGICGAYTIRVETGRYLDDPAYEECYSQRGCHSKVAALLDDYAITTELLVFARAQLKQKNNNFTALRLRDYAQTLDSVKGMIAEIGRSGISSSSNSEGGQLTVSYKMALLWMHKHGFVIDTKSSKYVDGHENPEVLQYREKFLARMAELAPRMLYRKPSQEEIAKWMRIKEQDPHSKLLPIIPISQDESTAWAADYYRGPAWTEKDKATSARFHEKSTLTLYLAVFCLYHEDGRSGATTIQAGGDNWCTSQKMTGLLVTQRKLLACLL